jgi:hypothetical protein
LTARQLMLKDLRRSGLSEDDAEAAGLEPLTRTETRRLTGLVTCASASYRLPYRDLDGELTDLFRLRFFRPLKFSDPNGNAKERRYWQPAKSEPGLYLPPGPDWAKLAKDPHSPLTITEGEKKALKATKDGELTAGLGGIWNWRAKKRDIDLLPLLQLLAPNREIAITFDGDSHTNSSVCKARDAFAATLSQYGARVWIVELPPGLALDDFLLRDGIDEYRRLPRRPFDPKRQVAVVRSGKGSPRVKKERISQIVQQDLSARGDFLRTSAGGLLYFDRDVRRLVDLIDPRQSDLRHYVNDRYGVNPSEAEWSFLYEDVSTHAYERGLKAEAHSFCHWDAARASLYLAASMTEMFRITTGGHERVANGTDDVFLRVPSHMEAVPQVLPKPNRGAFDYVLDIPNLAQGRVATPAQFRLLYELWLFAVLFGPAALPTRPIALLHSDKGGGKSTAGRALKRTLEGPTAEVSLIDADRLDGLDAALASQHLVILDNVDGRHRGIENRLAVAATGGELTKRRLYTTSEELRQPVRAFVVATTRQPDSFTRDDVVDRLLYLPCERRTSFKPEGSMLEKVDAQRAGWWAYVLATLPALVSAMRKPQDLISPFRMADFARFAHTIAKPLGYRQKDVTAALTSVEREKVSFVAEQSPLPDALLELSKAQSWQRKKDDFHSATELLAALRAHVHDFPIRNVQHFGQRLKTELAAIAERVSLEAKQNRHTKAWQYRLRQREERS